MKTRTGTTFSLVLMCVALSAVFTAGCRNGSSGSTATPEVPFRADGELTFHRGGAPISTIEIEIADTDSSRTRGLMQRSSMAENTGMLFVFPTSDYQSFWMANTQISLDMLFVDAESTVVEIHKYTRPLSAENVGGSRLSRFVVEVPAGYTDTHGIVEGDQIRW